MVSIIQSILLDFRPCFSRKATFHWFIVIILAFIIRCDNEGVTSFIRWLFLNPGSYDPMLRFFRATSWSLETLLGHWVKIAINRYPLLKFNGRALLIGDGIKVSKEAKKMPGVKSLHQDSENSGKAKYIYGHHFGYVGLLVGCLTKAFCLPLQGQLHEGVETIHPEKGLDGKPATLVTRMANLVVEKAKQTDLLCYVTLDAYFAVG
ncbi:MAG: transposase, partial [bacterium]|nr:transposase [bacterium]